MKRSRSRLPENAFRGGTGDLVLGVGSAEDDSYAGVVFMDSLCACVASCHRGR